MAQIFGFTETLPLNAKDVFVWRKFSKSDKSNDCNYGKECFFKVINMSIVSDINLQRKNGNEATIKSSATYIQQVIFNILSHFKLSRLAYVLSKQVILDGILISGYSPMVMSRMIFYNMIKNF